MYLLDATVILLMVHNFPKILLLIFLLEKFSLWMLDFWGHSTSLFWHGRRLFFVHFTHGSLMSSPLFGFFSFFWLAKFLMLCIPNCIGCVQHHKKDCSPGSEAVPTYRIYSDTEVLICGWFVVISVPWVVLGICCGRLQPILISVKLF